MAFSVFTRLLRGRSCAAPPLAVSARKTKIMAMGIGDKRIPGLAGSWIPDSCVVRADRELKAQPTRNVRWPPYAGIQVYAQCIDISCSRTGRGNRPRRAARKLSRGERLRAMPPFRLVLRRQTA